MPKPTILNASKSKPKARPVQDEMFPPAVGGAAPQRSKHAHQAPDDEEEENEFVDSRSLPEAGALDDKPTAILVTELLVEATNLKQQSDAAKVRLDGIRHELFVLTQAFELPGVRHQGLAFINGGMKTRRQLNKMILIENGVSPDVINASYKESKPFESSRLVKVKP